ncbi:MAG: hypothetical protein IJ086_07440 [Clostridium sp.]|nr:hypothetical protein [Clostridium sp.]MBQ8998502.1 hypothetical protein [Clostridium sp.]
MEYATVDAVESSLIVFRTFFMTTYNIIGIWALLSIILTFLKMFVSQSDVNGTVQKILDIIKYLVLLYLIGNATFITSLVYNGDNLTTRIINLTALLIPTIISILVIVGHKILLNKKSSLNHSESGDDEPNDVSA